VSASSVIVAGKSNLAGAVVMNASYRHSRRPIVTAMLGVRDLSNMGCLSFRSRIPAAPIDAFRAKRAGRVKAA
jgi:hypothetical protein